MNCTKIIPPLPIFLNFYYYYSYFTLSITLAMTPLLFYVILTQSKNLNSFKWLILNHSFWCLIFELFFTSVKPLILSPTLSGYLLGWLRNGSIKITGTVAYSFCTVTAINMCSLGATLACRYFLVFPATNSWFNKKRGITFFSSCLFMLSMSFLIPFYLFMSMDSVEMYKSAIAFDTCLIDFFKEPSFMFLAPEISTFFVWIVFSIVVIVLILLIFVATYFIYLVKTKFTATTKTKLSNSLMSSAIVQLSISIFFIMIPLTALLGILAFEIPHTENVLIVIFCCLLNHSFLEFFATLYFVSPYRKYVIKLFNQACICFVKNSRQISVVSNNFAAIQ